jgi:hypothetical protein
MSRASSRCGRRDKRRAQVPAAAMSKLDRATMAAPVSAAVTISIAASEPLPIASTPPQNISAPITRQICPSRFHRSLPRSVNASPAANTARPMRSAVNGVGTSATAPPLTATIPKAMRMLIANAPVSWAAKARRRSASAGVSLPSSISLERSSVTFIEPPGSPVS